MKVSAREQAVEQLLSETPPLIPSPPYLSERIVLAIEQQRLPAHRHDMGLRRRDAAVLAAACLAVAVGAGVFMQMQEQTAPSPKILFAEVPPLEERQTFVGSLDPAPLMLPTAQRFAVSLDQPLMKEARSVMDDTRRAADFVVSCLPFTRGG